MNHFLRPSDIEASLSLLEKSNRSQQEEHLLLLEKSDPAKAALLRVKLLSAERIFSLDEETLGRVLEDIEETTLALSLVGVDIELRKRALRLVGGNRQKAVGEILRKCQATDPEVEAAQRSLIQKVRQLEKKGRIHLGRLVANKKKAA